MHLTWTVYVAPWRSRKNYVRLRATPRSERKVAIVLANYPIRDGRLANGVGYDAPASTIEILRHLGQRTAFQSDGNALIEQLQSGPTQCPPGALRDGIPFPLSPIASCSRRSRRRRSARSPNAWGEPAADPFVRGAALPSPGVTLRQCRGAAAAGARL